MSASWDCARIVAKTGMNAGICALGAYAFSTFSPATAAIFGASTSLGRSALGACLYDKNDSVISSVMKTAAVYAATAASAAWCMNLAGIEISFKAAAVLTSLMGTVSFLLVPIRIGCVCCFCLKELYDFLQDPEKNKAKGT